jgi:Zn-dependent M16 (insulinase) family peptidase
MDKVDLGFDWVHKLLWNTHWSMDRVKHLTDKMMSDVKELKRTGIKLATALMNDILFKDGG